MPKAMWVGGPKHGKTYNVPEGHGVLVLPEPFRAEFFRVDDPYPFSEFKTTTCEVFSLPLAPGGRSVYGIRHPEITMDTARRYLADLVLTAWDNHLKEGGRR